MCLRERVLAVPAEQWRLSTTAECAVHWLRFWFWNWIWLWNWTIAAAIDLAPELDDCCSNDEQGSGSPVKNHCSSYFLDEQVKRWRTEDVVVWWWFNIDEFGNIFSRMKSRHVTHLISCFDLIRSLWSKGCKSFSSFSHKRGFIIWYIPSSINVTFSIKL